MLAPKREKFRKSFRGKMGGIATRGSKVEFGDFGLKALTAGWVSAKQIESGRKVLTRYTQKGGRVWIRIFPDKPITDKPPEVRMGGGKGDVVEHVSVVKPGRILFEISGVPEELVKKAFSTCGAKLPVKTKMVERE